MTMATASGQQPFVEETVADVDRHLNRLRNSLARVPEYAGRLSTVESEALRLQLLQKVDRWLDCRLALTGDVPASTAAEEAR